MSVNKFHRQQRTFDADDDDDAARHIWMAAVTGGYCELVAGSLLSIQSPWLRDQAARPIDLKRLSAAALNHSKTPLLLNTNSHYFALV